MAVRGIRELIVRMGSLTAQAHQQIERNVTEATTILEQAVRKNASLTDHSLEALRKMGHPYARRAPQRIHTPTWLVHKQSGRLLDAVFQQRVSTATHIRGIVGIDEGQAPHARYVVYGTSKMVSRDFLGKTLQTERKKLIKIISTGINLLHIEIERL